MRTAHDRYAPRSAGHPDDGQWLVSLVALLAADPQLDPVAAIRSLGISSPTEIRRLRSELRIEQAKLAASGRRPTRFRLAPARIASTPVAVASPRPGPATTKVLSLPVSAPARRAIALPSAPGLDLWCDISFGALSAAVEAQSAITQCWLRLPAVSMAMRAQLAVSEVGVAIYARSKKRPLSLH